MILRESLATLCLLAAAGVAHAQTFGDQLFKLTPDDAAVVAARLFGFSVAIDGDLAIVGAFQDDDAGSRSGSAYVFSTVPEAGSGTLLAAVSLVGAAVSLARRRRNGQ